LWFYYLSIGNSFKTILEIQFPFFETFLVATYLISRSNIFELFLYLGYAFILDSTPKLLLICTFELNALQGDGCLVGHIKGEMKKISSN